MRGAKAGPRKAPCLLSGDTVKVLSATLQNNLLKGALHITAKAAQKLCMT